MTWNDQMAATTVMTTSVCLKNFWQKWSKSTWKYFQTGQHDYYVPHFYLIFRIFHSTTFIWCYTAMRYCRVSASARPSLMITCPDYYFQNDDNRITKHFCQFQYSTNYCAKCPHWHISMTFFKCCFLPQENSIKFWPGWGCLE